VVSQVLVADVVDPNGDRVRVAGQFFWLVLSCKPLQITLGHRSDGGEESLVRAPQLDHHLGEGLRLGRLNEQLVEGIVPGRA
jgi:hypothetical protein